MKPIMRATDERLTPYLAKARELKAYLLSSMLEQIVCHGDLHLDNIISDGGSWIAIDPKGIVAEVAFEAAWFDLYDVADLQSSIQKLANALSIDYERLLAWFFVRQVISAQWFIEDDLDPTRALTMLERLDPLLTKRYLKEHVFEAYDLMANWYTDARTQTLFEKPILDQLLGLIPSGAHILDLGCGTGKPIAAYLISEGAAVTGVEGSIELINVARQQVPQMALVHLDMRDINFSQSFDAIVAWHSFFHLGKNDQRAMFPLFAKRLKPGGILLFTSGPEEGEVWSDNGGQMLYHASLSEHEYRQLLVQHHFDVLTYTVEDPECGGATVWMAQYKGGSV